MEAQRVLFVGPKDQLWRDLYEQLEMEGVASSQLEATRQACTRTVLASAFAVLVSPLVSGTARLDLCRHFHDITHRPIIVMTEDIEEAEELRLVATGVCDIVFLPIRPRVLAAQLANRMNHASADIPDRTLVYENVTLNAVEHLVTVAGVPVGLTQTEFDLLSLLMEHPKRVYTHEELSRWIWHDPWNVDHHRLEAHASRLRKKITVAGGPSIVGSVRGVGYRLVATSDLSGSHNLAM